MKRIDSYTYNVQDQIDRIFSKFDNVDEINKYRPFLQTQSTHERIYKIEKTGDFYAGEVLNNKKHGFGRLICANGSFYEGHWECDKYSGEGFYIDNEGNFIKGYFNDHKPEGYCIL